MHSKSILSSLPPGISRLSLLAASLALAALVSVPSAAWAETAAAKGDVVRAQAKNSMCIGCHGIPGYRTAYPVVYAVPLIAGQSEGYLISALRAYKAGERSHPSMRAIAGSLSETDMADLAAYYAAAKAQ